MIFSIETYQNIPVIYLSANKNAAQPKIISYENHIQYDGSKDDLDWRIDFKYFNFFIYEKFEIYAN